MKKLSIRKKFLAILISGNILFTGCSISGNITEESKKESSDVSYTQSSTLDNTRKYESSSEESSIVESSISKISEQSSLETNESSIEESQEIVEETSVEEESEYNENSNEENEYSEVSEHNETDSKENDDLVEDSTNDTEEKLENDSDNELNDEDENSMDDENVDDEKLESNEDEASYKDDYNEESSDEEYDDSNEIYTDDNSYIRATGYVNVRTKPNPYSDTLDLLYPGDTLKKLGFVDDYYIVEYNNEKGYVAFDYSEEINQLEDQKNDEMEPINSDSLNISNICYFPNGTTLYSDANLNYEIMDIPSLESAEIYYQEGNAYYVETDGNRGYVSKASASIISQPVIVVDESDQLLKLYKDNNIKMEFPVVTGNYPNYASTKGLFNIFSKSYNANLVGETWDVYVNVFMGYTVYGEGIHDAVWRDYSEFGGTTYQGNGSHGCVNCRYDDVMALADEVEVGDKVLVKR